ncbi:three prime repair exonuclease 2-like [Diachasma alloeum]|uniref:three prime repair exonuclease 2-like n=1 Tax=Diachasma alloeum TaxID=454923 RepID=UPI0007382ABA|nr:three prime repair exonuclease 2-like [Diachasma alloeum]
MSPLAAVSISSNYSPQSYLRSSSHPHYSIVFFDLETTGLTPDCEIMQIAAKCGGKMYRTYILPTNPIPQIVKNITGITVINNKMFARGRPVTGVTRVVAVRTFIKFLRSFGEKVILVAQNGFKFDGPLLCGILNREKMMAQFQDIVIGFSDPLPLFRHHLPGRRECGKTYGLVSLANDYLGGSSGAHDAMNDVVMLEKLILNEIIPTNVDHLVLSHKTVGCMADVFNRNLMHYHDSPKTWDAWK